MNKKFLSAILFGALMVFSTGTFVSCKDYDDDIDRIDNTLNDLKSKLDALQTKVEGGKYVTNVAKDGEGIIITWNDNSTNKIETIKGDKGDKGDAVEITIDPTTKNWKIDGVDTGICAEGKNGTSSNGVNAKSPSIDPTTGNWVVYEWNEEKQEYVGTDTGISAKGASAYVVDEGNYYTLNVAADKAGSSYTTVKLPKTPVVITEIEVLGLVESEDGVASIVTEGNKFQYNYTFIEALTDAHKEWNKEEGVKKLAAGQVLSTLEKSNFLVRVAPAKLDASKFTFSLVNSKLAEAPLALDAPVACNDLLVRAISGNGLWTIAATAKEGLTYDKAADYENEFKKGGKAILFALQEKDGFATLYDLSFEKKNDMELTAKVDKVNAESVSGSQNSEYGKTELQALKNEAGQSKKLNEISLGDVAITFDNAVYDAHLHIDNATIQRWGITNVNGTSFTVNKRPDDVTVANFQVQVHYVTLKGEVKSEYIPFKVGKSYANVTTLASKNIEISATNANNKFENSLDPMYTNLGDNVDLWKADVDELVITYEYFNADGKWVAADGTNNAGNIKAELDEKTSKVTVSMVSNTTKMDLTKSYRVKINFEDVNGEVLNTVYQPITFSIPAMSHIFVQQPGVFVDGVAYAYMDAKANRGGNAVAASYNVKGAFVDLANKLGTSTFKANLDAETKIVDDYRSEGLAELNDTELAKDDIATWTITLKDVEKSEINGTQKGYGKELIVNITNVKYLNVYDYKDEVYTFKISVLSPILEGKVTAIGGEVIVPATKQDGYKVNDSHIKGYTYNNEVYSIFSDAKAPEYWKRKEINSVNFATGNENVFTCDATGSDYVDAKNLGSVTVYPKNLKETTSENMTVTVKDAWGYTLTQKVKVTVKVGE
ncbi:MAG: hypothetical protein EL88_00970 [Phocaeicola dorei]|nr:MAG: hypothetical protein EL88_00970 [Phocaeicola dorei]